MSLIYLDRIAERYADSFEDDFIAIENYDYRNNIYDYQLVYSVDNEDYECYEFINLVDLGLQGGAKCLA